MLGTHFFITLLEFSGLLVQACSASRLGSDHLTQGFSMTDGILDTWSSAWFEPAQFLFEISDLRIRHDRCSLNHIRM
jgi:hypothetical protein